MKIYLSGPMTGYPSYNYPLFNAAAAELRAKGHSVYNPAEFKHTGTMDQFPIEEAFVEFSRQICLHVNTLVMLPGWHFSVGARAEWALAQVFGHKIIEWDTI